MADEAMMLQEGFSHKFRRSGCNFYIPHKVHTYTSTCLSSMVCLLRDQIGRFPLGGWLVGGGGGGGRLQQVIFQEHVTVFLTVFWKILWGTRM